MAQGTPGIGVLYIRKGARMEPLIEWSPDGEIAQHSERQFFGKDWFDNSQWLERRGRFHGFGLPLWFDGAITSIESHERSTGNRDGRDSLQPWSDNDRRGD